MGYCNLQVIVVWDRSHFIIDGACKDSERRMNEIIFWEAQIKILIQAIRVTKDVDSIRSLRAVTRETIERMEERKHQEELKRLQEKASSVNGQVSS